MCIRDRIYCVWKVATGSRAIPDEQKFRVCFGAVFFAPSEEDVAPRTLLSKVRRFVKRQLHPGD
eukprot:1541263-Lingulodinium_polyedra.AAC.1